MGVAEAEWKTDLESGAWEDRLHYQAYHSAKTINNEHSIFKKSEKL